MFPICIYLCQYEVKDKDCKCQHCDSSSPVTHAQIASCYEPGRHAPSSASSACVYAPLHIVLRTHLVSSNGCGEVQVELVNLDSLSSLLNLALLLLLQLHVLLLITL